MIIIMLNKRRKKTHYLLYENEVPHSNKLQSPSPKDALCQIWLNWPSSSGGEDFKISSMYLCYFVNISPWKRLGPSFEHTSIPFTQDALCQVWLKLAQWFWRKRFFLILSMYFRYLVIISPWKRVGPFI